MNKDYTGNKKSPFVTIGATGHSSEQREAHDFYATDPEAVRLLLEQEDFLPNIWEPAAGLNHIADELKQAGYKVRVSDIVRRLAEQEEIDFLQYDSSKKWKGDIITNPPYRYAINFARKGLDILRNGNKLALLLKLTFLEGINRKKFFEQNPPVRIYVFSKRIRCAKNGEFDKYKSASAMCFAWFVWQKGFNGKPTIDWL